MMPPKTSPLGKRQIETLAKLTRAFRSESMILQIKIYPWRRFTREGGGGSGYPITAEIIYRDNGDSDLRSWIGCCTSLERAIEKGQTIARYCCEELGLQKEDIKLGKDKRC